MFVIIQKYDDDDDDGDGVTAMTMIYKTCIVPFIFV